MLFQLDNVGHVFSNKDHSTVALREVSFSVNEGEFVSIVGPSGCGKTSVLRLIAGILRPAQGHVQFASKLEAEMNFGFVFQEAVLLPWRTVSANISLALEILRVPEDTQQARVAEVLAMVGLEEFANHLPNQLSGGMQQRVSLARALVTEPRTLLMDEPFSALDTFTREDLNGELQRIWMASGKTIVFVTHSIVESVFLSDRVLVMSQRPGTIVGSIEVDMPRPRLDQVRESSAFVKYCGAVRKMLSGEKAGNQAKVEHDES